MATVINNPPPNERGEHIVVQSDSSGWVIAIILLIIIAAGVFWFLRARPAAPAPAAQPGANINVTVPQVPGTDATPPTGGTGAPDY